LNTFAKDLFSSWTHLWRICSPLDHIGEVSGPLSNTCEGSDSSWPHRWRICYHLEHICKGSAPLLNTSVKDLLPSLLFWSKTRKNMFLRASFPKRRKMLAPYYIFHPSLSLCLIELSNL
jgi:hypothetical protein